MGLPTSEIYATPPDDESEKATLQQPGHKLDQNQRGGGCAEADSSVLHVFPAKTPPKAEQHEPPTGCVRKSTRRLPVRSTARFVVTVARRRGEADDQARRHVRRRAVGKSDQAAATSVAAIDHSSERLIWRTALNTVRKYLRALPLRALYTSTLLQRRQLRISSRAPDSAVP